jgi:hypothetical protein
MHLMWATMEGPQWNCSTSEWDYTICLGPAEDHIIACCTRLAPWQCVASQACLCAQ